MGTSQLFGFLGGLIDPISTLLDKWIPDADKRQEISYQIATLAETHAHEEILAQIEVNKVEAASPSLFKGGWRPGAGWVCVIAMANNYVVAPYIKAVFDLDLPVLNLGELMPVLFGMLGLGWFRTQEKQKGVAAP